jgi:hemerythrin-like domain-containing protein
MAMKHLLDRLHNEPTADLTVEHIECAAPSPTLREALERARRRREQERQRFLEWTNRHNRHTDQKASEGGEPK